MLSSVLVALVVKAATAVAPAAPVAVPGRRLWLLSFHNFISTYYAPLLFRPAAYLRGLRNLFGELTSPWHE
jgi:hypothetical protein